MLLEEFSTIFDRPEKVKKLREYILSLAVRGKLVNQDENDEPASVLLERIKEEKERLIKEKKIKKEKPLPKINEDEIPYELPRGWEWVRLGEIINISSGKNLTKSKMSKNGNIPVYGGNGITGHHDEFNVDEETIVIGRVGFYCGSIHLTEKKAWITDNAFITKFPKQYIYIYYLVWLLKGTNLKKEENATAQPVISGRKLYPIIVGIPPLNEQKRIVKKLDYLMEFCDKLEIELEKKVKYGSLSAKSVLNSVSNCSSYEELEESLRFIIDNFKDLTLADSAISELKNTILSLAVKGKLVPQNESDEPAIVLLERIRGEKERLIKEKKIKKEKPLYEINEDEIPYELPKGWEWVRLGEIVSFNIGKTPDRKNSVYWENGKYPWVSISDMEHRKVIFNTKEKVSEVGFYECFKGIISPKGTLIMSFKLTIGKISILGMDALHNEAIVSIYPHIDEMKLFLFKLLNGFELTLGTKDAIKGKTLNSQSMKNIMIALPPLNEQKRIVEKVDKLMKICDELESRIEESKKYSEKLMNSILIREF